MLNILLTIFCWRGPRGGLIVCGAPDQCSVRGPRALKNAVVCGCVLYAFLCDAEMPL
jgi:hypothetical protein